MGSEMVTLELPDSCLGAIVYLVRLKTGDTPEHIPGWNFHGDVEDAGMGPMWSYWRLLKHD